MEVRFVSCPPYFCYDSRRLYHRVKIVFKIIDKRDLIDEVSIYKWVEIALKKFGGDITMRKEAVVDVKRGQARMPGDYFDLILAFKCDLKDMRCLKVIR